MRKYTVICDHCGNEVTYEEDTEQESLVGWSFIHFVGAEECKSCDLCPKCSEELFSKGGAE